MSGFSFDKNKFLLAASVLLIYVMSPLIGYRYEVAVSMIFGMLVILASCPRWDVKHIRKYIIFLVLIVLARHSLCCWQPWVVLFDHGLYESSPLPFLIVFAVSSLMGWLLLERWRNRFKYAFITMGIQMMLYLILMNDVMEPVLLKFPHFLGSRGEYPGIWEAWQFEWMLVYYLPIYFLSRSERRTGILSK